MSELTPLFEPEGLMVVGASSSPQKLGAVMAKSLASSPTPLVLVNSRATDDSVFSTVADAVASCNSAVDLAVLCVPAAAVSNALRDCAASGVRAAVVCSGGFAEAGGIGVEFQRQTTNAIHDTGIRLLGPNTSGFCAPYRGLKASFVPGVSELTPGSVAIVASSGGVNHVLAFRLQQAGVGVSLAVGLGAAIDVAAHDVLDYLVDHEETAVVGLHIETIRDGQALIEAVSRLSLRKPVVALVVGRSDNSDFARSHTGSLATSWRTTRAALRHAGAVIVDDENQLLDSLVALSGRRLAPATNPGVAVITGQAGPGLLMMDALSSACVSVPRLSAVTQSAIRELLPPLTFQANPVDTGRPGPGFDRVIAAVAADDHVDAIGIYGLTEPVADLPGAVASSGAARGIPVLIGVDGPRSEVDSVRASAGQLGIPVICGPSSLARGLIAIVEDARVQSLRAAPTSDKVNWPDIRGPWDEIRSKDLLNALGIPTPARRRCNDHASALSALAELNGPVAVKLVDSKIIHKTEIGGVYLGISSPTALEQALVALDSVGATEYLLEEMAPAGVDLVVGARRDPVFGPIVLFGLGGVAAEALADVAICPAPLSLPAAAAMVEELHAKALLFGFRSGPMLNVPELSQILVSLGSAIVSNEYVSDIEINPLRLTHGGLIALDAVVVVEEDK